MRVKDFPYCVLLSVLVSLVWLGCAARVVNNSKLQYVAPEFTDSSLAEHGLSLLPVVAGHGQEGLRRPLAAKLDTYLTTKLPEGKFSGSIQTLNLINEANLTKDYSQMIGDYDRAAILNKSTLSKIGEATGIRYLLYVKLLDQSRTQKMAYGSISKKIVRLEGKNVSIFGQVWDLSLGDVVWEGTGEITVQAQSELDYVKQTIDDLVSLAAVSFLNNLPGIQIPSPK